MNSYSFIHSFAFIHYWSFSDIHNEYFVMLSTGFSVGDLLVCVFGGVAFLVLVIAAITTAFSKYKIKRRTVNTVVASSIFNNFN